MPIMKHFITFCIIIITGFTTHAQYFEPPVVERNNENIGFGIGIDYGGVGVRASVLSFERVDVFAGLGYNLVGLGWNAGLAYRFDNDENRVVPYANAMYGYNAVIVVETTGGFGGNTVFEETYYGPSVGGGIELHMNKRKNYFNFELLYPIRDPQYDKDLDMLKASGVQFEFEPLPISISIGYHIGL